jgi:ABC-type uncharacterized transport system involved in gliding motility auxiliary subunit
LYVLEGHGECDIRSTDRHTGCSGLRDALQSELYDVDALVLRSGDGVPSDADAVLVLGPRGDFLDPEIEALAGYLDAGGKLLVLVDPFTVPRFADFLARRGIEAQANIVLDSENRLGGGEPFSAAVPNLNRRHLVTGALESPPLFSSARALAAVAGDADDRRSDWLLRSGDHSWASYDPAVLEGSQARFVGGRDVNGPLTLGLEVWIPEAPPGGPRVTGGASRIIAYGDSDFVRNRFLDYLGNRDLLVNTLNWLIREEKLMAPRAPRKTPGVNWLFISEEKLRGMFIAAVVVQPLLFLAFGVAIALRRRLSP